MENIVE